jgi:5-(carboxyamino)imidazole ribonucleotide synthase
MTKIGILGAGQLGHMLALAGYPLGLSFRFLDPTADSPAGHLAEHIAADYHDQSALRRFLDCVDVVTYEFENVPVDVVKWMAESIPVHPTPLALEKGQDRLVEKIFFQSLGIPTPEFAQAGNTDIRFPCVLKTRRMGYDGKGQFVVHNEMEHTQALLHLGERPAIMEQFIPFDRELSLLAVRSRGSDVRFYPLIENTHREGILRTSIAPAPDVPPGLQKHAQQYALSILNALGYVGVLAIEFFQVGADLLANEMAPRVHNSGHYTIEGTVTSQFENHLRAVAGLPLGDTRPLGVCGMLNLIGKAPAAANILDIEGAHLHLYGKATRPGRKLGHVTFVENTYAALNAKLEELEKLLLDE